MWFLLFVALLVGVAQQADPAAQSRNVFGLELGAVMDLPKCPLTAAVERVCYSKPSWSSSQGLGDGETTLRFPEDSLPQMLAGWFGVLVLDGKLEGVRFETLGVTATDANIAKLTEKYGTPTKVERIPAQTLAGVAFERVYVEWVFSDLVVTLTSGRSRVDQGEIRVDTRRGLKWRVEEADKQSKKQRPI